jgi:hypothetical protein
MNELSEDNIYNLKNRIGYNLIYSNIIKDLDMINKIIILLERHRVARTIKTLTNQIKNDSSRINNI